MAFTPTAKWATGALGRTLKGNALLLTIVTTGDPTVAPVGAVVLVSVNAIVTAEDDAAGIAARVVAVKLDDIIGVVT